MEDLICEREEDSWLVVARRICRGGMFVHRGGQHWWENYCGNLLWQSSVTLLPLGEPYAGKLHVRFDEGAGVPHGASRSTLHPMEARPHCFGLMSHLR